MIGKTSIFQNLNTLERLYNDSSSVKRTLFYSKLAIFELCGWIEESMDDVALRCANRNLRYRQNRLFVKNNIIRPVYGFDYNKHFRHMLMQVVGLITLEKVEKRVDQTKFQIMKAALGSLKQIRDNEAHTHVKGITQILDSPSVTKRRFMQVYEGLKSFEDVLRSI